MNRVVRTAIKILGWTGALVLGAAIILVLLLYFTGFPGAINTGRTRYTHDRIVELADAFEKYRSARGRYPIGGCLDAVADASGQDSLLRFTDGWRRPFRIECNGHSYTIVSYARDGKPDAPDLASYTFGRTLDFDSDLVYSDGRYLQWPEQVRHSESMIQE